MAQKRDGPVVLQQSVITFLKNSTTTPLFHASGVVLPDSHAKDMNKVIVRPIAHRGRSGLEIASTRVATGVHFPSVTLTVPVDGQQLVLELELNVDLVPADHALLYQEGGGTITHKPTKEELDLCHYRGSVRGKPDSWVAVSTCRGVSGLIFDGVRTRYIQPAEGTSIQSAHLLYDLEHIHSTSYPEGLKDILDLHHTNRSQKTITIRNKRDNSHNTLGEPFTANRQSRYVELVLVAAQDVYHFNEGNITRIHQHFIQAANLLNAAYAPINIYVALVGVVVWSEQNDIQIGPQQGDTLGKFAHHRENVLTSLIPHDNAQIITTLHGGGLGFIGSMCHQTWSVATVGYDQNVAGMVGIMAHEMGHNLGMNHDEDFRENNITCECPDKECVQSGIGKMRFSSCSLKSLADWLSSGKDHCLRNKPSQMFSPSCGDGFVEPGEECDCGVVPPTGDINACHACCDMRTCRLWDGAVCGGGACCDFTTCRPKPPGAECRAAGGACDLPEYCTGASGFCPEDVYKIDGTSCGKEANQMCQNQVCITVNVNKVLKREYCPLNCSGYGVCNSKGHCHCDEGFAPPLCDAPGPGGSLDSGPATDPRVLTNFMIAMYAIFLAIIPCGLLAAYLIHCCLQDNLILKWRLNNYILKCTCPCGQNRSHLGSASRIRNVRIFRNIFKRRNIELPKYENAESPEIQRNKLQKDDIQIITANNVDSEEINAVSQSNIAIEENVDKNNLAFVPHMDDKPSIPSKLNMYGKKYEPNLSGNSDMCLKTYNNLKPRMAEPELNIIGNNRSANLDITTNQNEALKSVTIKPNISVTPDITDKANKAIKQNFADELNLIVKSKKAGKPIKSLKTNKADKPVKLNMSDPPIITAKSNIINNPNTADKPNIPVEPNTADKPNIPVIPNTADKPNIPLKPNTADKPNIPLKPNIANKQNKPVKPNTANKPNIPVKPNICDKHNIQVKPNIAAKPNKPVTPTKPNIPVKPKIVDKNDYTS